MKTTYSSMHTFVYHSSAIKTGMEMRGKKELNAWIDIIDKSCPSTMPLSEIFNGFSFICNSPACGLIHI